MTKYPMTKECLMTKPETTPWAALVRVPARAALSLAGFDLFNLAKDNGAFARSRPTRLLAVVLVIWEFVIPSSFVIRHWSFEACHRRLQAYRTDRQCVKISNIFG